MKKIYFDSKNKKDCNGCGTCSLICPKKCITMEEDEEGFFYPKVDKSKCIKCNKCKNVCSNFNEKKENNEKAYAVINTHKKYADKFSSGGMFFALAQYIIEKGGVVFGVRYTEELKVVHDYAENIDDVVKFCGSKYVRSDLKDSYLKVEEFLIKDRYVLFTGTPCQINGLKKYLGKEYEKLLLCDVICRANPSPKTFKMFKQNLENTNNKRVKMISFRGKRNGWESPNTLIMYEDGKEEKNNVFLNAFGADLINRPSCSKCVFVSKRRISDITIGDLWGVNEIFPSLQFKDGVSLLIINSLKGKQVFNEIKNKIKYKEVDYDKACSFNYFKVFPVYVNRKKFFKFIKKGKINEENFIEMMEKYMELGFCRKKLKRLKEIINA